MLSQIRLAITGIIVTAVLAACGAGESETNTPATPLTASTVTSSTVNGHSHSVTIPFSDPAGASQVNYLSSATDGHSHVIALSSQQFADLKNGLKLQVTSTINNGHSHTWTILGGNYLYESICYNCHSNDKRGSRGMSSNNLTNAQRDALQSPDNMPLSTATPADPTVQPGTGTVDGAALYASSCAGCHGALAGSAKHGRSATAIKNAIKANTGGMGSLSGLSDAQIQAIALALQ